jgi:hypothetical protein
MRSQSATVVAAAVKGAEGTAVGQSDGGEEEEGEQPVNRFSMV